MFFICASGTNLFSLVLERYIAVVKPLKYLTFMKRHRVIQMVFTSWGIPFLFTLIFALFSIRLDSFYWWLSVTIVGYLYLLLRQPCALHLCFLLFTAWDHTLATQLHFNHRVVKVQTRNNSVVKWVVLVTCVFLLCYGIFLRCSLLFLTGHKCGYDFYCKVPLQVINSGINPIAYAFFKRDVKQECKRLLFTSPRIQRHIRDFH